MAAMAGKRIGQAELIAQQGGGLAGASRRRGKLHGFGVGAPVFAKEGLQQRDHLRNACLGRIIVFG
ncbi:hypothetical protein D3C72_2433850 [compost metagenome]